MVSVPSLFKWDSFLFVCLFGCVVLFGFEANKIHRANCWFMFFQESIFIE